MCIFFHATGDDKNNWRKIILTTRLNQKMVYKLLMMNFLNWFY
jgi:hypothetical protein